MQISHYQQALPTYNTMQIYPPSQMLTNESEEEAAAAAAEEEEEDRLCNYCTYR